MAEVLGVQGKSEEGHTDEGVSIKIEKEEGHDEEEGHSENADVVLSAQNKVK
jgi:hypothetical protein